jgi:hypothetical protein
MSSRRLVSPSRRPVKKSGSSRGAELIEERLLGLQLLAERVAQVACHTAGSPWGGSLLDAGNSKWGAGNL